MPQYIELTQGKRAIVDDEFFDAINQHKWYAQKDWNTFYAYRSFRGPNGKTARVQMHREIFALAGIDPKECPDHRNGDGLDNQIENLRPATNSQNQGNRRKNCNNTSGYKGVDFSRGGWRARVNIAGKRKSIGQFKTAKEAALAYDAAAKEHYGEFARVNFPA